MPTGIGLSLSQSFYCDCVAPIIDRYHGELRYAAARVGDGSEVLGYDTAMSADHNYGPCLQLFLSEQDFTERSAALLSTLDRHLPVEFGGWPVRYASANRPGRPKAAVGALCADHGVEIFTLPGWCRRQFGADLSGRLTTFDWLGYPEQLFLTVTAGAVFRDDSGDLTHLRERLAYFPRDIWLYKLSAQWWQLAEQQAFVGRTGECGDDLGSRVIATRLVGDVMRLAFLVERRFAPYAKWFGTAFAGLDCAADLMPSISKALRCRAWHEREAALVCCYSLLARRQIEAGIPGAIAPLTGTFHERPFMVINAFDIARGLRSAIEDEIIRGYFPVGAVDQCFDAAVTVEDPQLMFRAIRTLLERQQAF